MCCFLSSQPTHFDTSFVKQFQQYMRIFPLQNCSSILSQATLYAWMPGGQPPSEVPPHGTGTPSCGTAGTSAPVFQNQSLVLDDHSPEHDAGQRPPGTWYPPYSHVPITPPPGLFAVPYNSWGPPLWPGQEPGRDPLDARTTLWGNADGSWGPGDLQRYSV